MRELNKNEWSKEMLNNVEKIPKSENFGELWLRVADEMGINIIEIIEEDNNDNGRG